MAMTGVLRPGHAQIRVLDLEESVKWYTEVMGLVPMGRDAQGRLIVQVAGTDPNRPLDDATTLTGVARWVIHRLWPGRT